jgi:hypothetical protein
MLSSLFPHMFLMKLKASFVFTVGDGWTNPVPMAATDSILGGVRCKLFPAEDVLAAPLQDSALCED